MKLIYILIIVPLSLVIGFVFASIWSALLASFILVFGHQFFFARSSKWLSFGIRLLSFSILIYAALYFGGLLGASKEVKMKVQLLEQELHAQNYSPKWVVISQKRSKLFNSSLAKSAQKSQHLEGKAIDLYVFDVNGDWIFNEVDVDILYQAIKKIEKTNPELVGGFGIYLKAGNPYLTRHMIHIDIRPIHTKFYK